MAPEAPAGEIRDGFKFRSGHHALDFTATLTGRLRDRQTDLLAEPGDLGRWLVAAGLSSRRPEVARATLERARTLREALYRLATAAIRDRPLPAPDRIELNRIAKGAAAAPVLTPDGSMKFDGTADSLLVLIARMGVELLGSDPAPRIRQCDGEYCAILFVDASRKRDRRWCSMSACGNKAKAADFRRRSAEGRE